MSNWNIIQEEAKVLLKKLALKKRHGKAYVLSDFYTKSILEKDSLHVALAEILCDILEIKKYHRLEIVEVFSDILNQEKVSSTVEEDMQAVIERDAACPNKLSVILYYKGFHALCLYRITNALLYEGDAPLAAYIQSLCCRKLSVDIHPRASIMGGVFIDHGDSVVIGETAVIESDVSILQDVTLGGTGKEGGDRHPKVRRGVLIGAGAKILGNIEIGKYSKIGAGSVVLFSVPPYATAVGVPARIIAGKVSTTMPSKKMNHFLNLQDTASDKTSGFTVTGS